MRIKILLHERILVVIFALKSWCCFRGCFEKESHKRNWNCFINETFLWYKIMCIHIQYMDQQGLWLRRELSLFSYDIKMKQMLLQLLCFPFLQRTLISLQKAKESRGTTKLGRKKLKRINIKLWSILCYLLLIFPQSAKHKNVHKNAIFCWKLCLLMILMAWFFIAVFFSALTLLFRFFLSCLTLVWSGNQQFSRAKILCIKFVISFL